MTEAAKTSDGLSALDRPNSYIGKSVPTPNLDRACWQGEAVAAIVATSRALAEDAAELVAVDYEALEPVTDMRTALDPATPVIHASLGDNLAFERNFEAGSVDQAFAESDAVVEDRKSVV